MRDQDTHRAGECFPRLRIMSQTSWWEAPRRPAFDLRIPETNPRNKASGGFVHNFRSSPIVHGPSLLFSILKTLLLFCGVEISICKIEIFRDKKRLVNGTWDMRQFSMAFLIVSVSYNHRATNSARKQCFQFALKSCPPPPKQWNWFTKFVRRK